MKNIRVIAFSRSLKVISEEKILLSENKLKSLGYNVSFSKNCNICDSFKSLSIKSRIFDFNSSLKDKNVDIVLSAIGGYNSNQLLDYIDYDLIKKNPKVICGFSDITILLNAIYAKTNIVTFLGPNFYNFAMIKGIDSTIDIFEKIINGKSYSLSDPEMYISDKWNDNQENRKFIKNKGMYVINNGQAEGKIIGGNLCSFNLLQGTNYMPDLEGKILFLEDDSMLGKEFPYEFDRNLQSLIHQKDFNKIKGIIIGRTQIETKMNITKWKKILCTKPELKNIPIIINTNFGHTTPNATIPIGGTCIIDTTKNRDKIIIKI